MIPLKQLVRGTDTSYSNYLSKKTSVLSSVTESEKSQWLWFTLIKSYNFTNQYASLSENLQKTLLRLLDNFGHLPEDSNTNSLEKKLPWVLKHPQRGIFLPLEIYKLLMQEKYLAQKNYLFTLLYNLRINEQKEMASFVGTNIEAQLSITFESNTLDMALVLYIWFSKQMSYSLVKEKNISKGRLLPLRSKEIIVEKPVISHCSEEMNLWQHLKQGFPKEDLESTALRENIEKGRKGFYRSLSLISNKQSRFKDYFRNAWLVPMLPPNWRQMIDKLEVVTPREALANRFEN